MNFFVISDIHGSASALKKSLEIYKEGDYRKLIICGDLLYHGARNPLPKGYNPKEVIELLNEVREELIVVEGNCESEVDSMVLNFPIKGKYNTLVLEKRDLFITHGHGYSPENLPPLKTGSIFLSGHTHIPKAEYMDVIYICNPGSISLPKGGFEPSFGILTEENWSVIGLDSGETIIQCNF